MIIKIKKRDLIILLALLAIPIIYAAQVTQTFYILVTLGNRGPTIFYVNISNVTPIAGTTASIDIQFNVSDEDGFGDLNDTSANVTVIYNGVKRTSSSCTSTDYNTNYTKYVCSITFFYYDNSSSNWIINASIKDNSGNLTYNSTWNLTVNSLSSMAIFNNLTFSGATLGQQDKAPTSPLALNNTGNFDFTKINITAYWLVGMSDSAYQIGAGNFTVNITDAQVGVGMKLQNATSLLVVNATLPHKLSAIDTDANETLYFWLDVPSSSEITAQNYNATTLWVATVE